MPVQNGMGKPDLDFIVTTRGHPLRIETKVDGKQPTPRQLKTIEDLVAAECSVLIIDQHNLMDLYIVMLEFDRSVSGPGQIAGESRGEYTK